MTSALKDRVTMTPRLIALAPILLLLGACAEDNVECRAATDCVVATHICLDNRCQDFPAADDNRTPPGGGIGAGTDTGGTTDTGSAPDTGADTSSDTTEDATPIEEVGVTCADITVSPSSLNLGSGDPGEDITGTLVVRNGGPESVVVTSIFVPSPFNVRSPSLGSFPLTVAAGSSVTATIALVAGSDLQRSSIDIITDVCPLELSVRGITE